MSQKSTTRRLASWSLELQGYNIKISHKEGKSNAIADARSRLSYQEQDENFSHTHFIDKLIIMAQ